MTEGIRANPAKRGLSSEDRTLRVWSWLVMMMMMVACFGLVNPVAMASTHSWKVEQLPGKGELLGISCGSPSLCVAAGQRTEVWEGKGWNELSPAPPEVGLINNFNSVSCASSGACEAVGATVVDGSEILRSLAEVYDKGVWAFQATPGLLENDEGVISSFAGVSCVSASDCQAVGAEAERWNGLEWTVEKEVKAWNLQAVSCPSATYCMAVGSINDRAGSVSWNGGVWQIKSTPDPSETIISSVSCVSSTFCAAVGLGPHSQSLVEIWNGTHWRVMPVRGPRDRFGTLTGVACVSRSACTAIGNQFETGLSDSAMLDLFWNGHIWSVEPSAHFPAHDVLMFGISCLSKFDCWGIGGYGHDRIAVVHES